VRVTDVQPDSAAARSGLRPDDVIVRLAEMRVVSADDLQRVLGPEAIGERLAMDVVRDGEMRRLEATPVELPGRL
jgi:S1-C subfamily serine protease